MHPVDQCGNACGGQATTPAADPVGNYGRLGDLAGARIGNYAEVKQYRSGIRERIDQAMRTSYQANERAFIANEIGVILDKNPDFSRLLDLLDRF